MARKEDGRTKMMCVKSENRRHGRMNPEGKPANVWKRKGANGGEAFSKYYLMG